MLGQRRGSKEAQTSLKEVAELNDVALRSSRKATHVSTDSMLGDFVSAQLVNAGTKTAMRCADRLSDYT